MAKTVNVENFFSYMGNKSDLADWIIPMIPPHKFYVEVFGGTGAILLNKHRSQFECYNDLNVNLSNLFEVVRSCKEEFLEELKSHNISQVTYERFYMNHEPVKIPDVEMAVRYYYIMSLCAMGKYNGGFQPNFDNQDITKMFYKEEATIDKIYKRIKEILVFCRPYNKIIKKFDNKDTFLYLDPPYKDTEEYYKKLVGDFTVEDHIKLRDMLSAFQGKWLLSYEDNDFIRELYKGFKIQYKNKLRPQKGKNAVEIVITNYSPATSLFELDSI